MGLYAYSYTVLKVCPTANVMLKLHLYMARTVVQADTKFHQCVSQLFFMSLYDVFD